MIVACNRCGETVQDDPKEAIGTIHVDEYGQSILNCNGTFVEMTIAEADALDTKNLAKTVIQFGTK